jgi:hypothetical protein
MTPTGGRLKAEQEDNTMSAHEMTIYEGVETVPVSDYLAAICERDEAREEAEKLRESLRCLLNPQCAVEEAAK